MFVLTREYHIRPWEYNLDGEKYPEDLSTLIAFGRLESESLKKEQNKSTANQNLSEIFKKK